MTSAPVKDVNALMNFIGGKNFTKTGGMTQTDSFGDVMSKAQSDSTGSQNKSVSGRQTEKVSATTVTNRKNAVQTQKTVKDSAKTEEVTAGQEQALKEAGQEVVEEIAKEFNVTVEDVERAMEELGLSIYSLFNPADLTQLVLNLNGGLDMAALLTDENLFAGLKDLLGMMNQVKTDFMQEMNLTPEDMQTLLETLKNEPVTDVTEIADMENIPMDMAEEETVPQITVEVKSGGEEIKLAVDEKGNATGTVEVIPSDAEKSITENHADSNSKSNSDAKKGQSEGMLQTGNQLLDALLQDKVQAAEGTFEQAPVFFSEQSQDIMNQIMDYMKIQLKPGMEQLEMQLHPASLGTVQIQILNRGGEITAQFHVQNETVKAAIESQIATLQENLKEQGVKVSAVQVTVESNGFESNLWQGQGREENASSQNGRRAPRRINLNEADEVFGEEVSEEEVLAAKLMEANGNTVDYTV